MVRTLGAVLLVMSLGGCGGLNQYSGRCDSLEGPVDPGLEGTVTVRVASSSLTDPELASRVPVGQLLELPCGSWTEQSGKGHLSFTERLPEQSTADGARVAGAALAISYEAGEGDYTVVGSTTARQPGDAHPTLKLRAQGFNDTPGLTTLYPVVPAPDAKLRLEQGVLLTFDQLAFRLGETSEEVVLEEASYAR